MPPSYALGRAVKGCGWRAAGASEQFAPAARWNGRTRGAQRSRGSRWQYRFKTQRRSRTITLAHSGCGARFSPPSHPESRSCTFSCQMRSASLRWPWIRSFLSLSSGVAGLLASELIFHRQEPAQSRHWGSRHTSSSRQRCRQSGQGWLRRFLWRRAKARRVRSNPSLKRSTYGRLPAPGRRYAVHSRRPGAGVPPPAPA